MQHIIFFLANFYSLYPTKHCKHLRKDTIISLSILMFGWCEQFSVYISIFYNLILTKSKQRSRPELLTILFRPGWKPVSPWANGVHNNMPVLTGKTWLVCLYPYQQNIKFIKNKNITKFYIVYFELLECSRFISINFIEKLNDFTELFALTEEGFEKCCHFYTRLCNKLVPKPQGNSFPTFYCR